MGGLYTVHINYIVGVHCDVHINCVIGINCASSCKIGLGEKNAAKSEMMFM